MKLFFLLYFLMTGWQDVWFLDNMVATTEGKNRVTEKSSLFCVVLVTQMCNFPEKPGRCYFNQGIKVNIHKDETNQI